MFIIFSFLAICPGLYFRPHYFVLLLPVSSMLVGLSIYAGINLLSNTDSVVTSYAPPILIIMICFTVSLYHQRNYFFKMTPMKVSRDIYGLNPFPESITISKFIHKHTNKDDKIVVIGSEPQIYFYSRRRSATGYIYMYGLMEKHDFAMQMQKELIQNVESAKPKYIVYVGIYTSWLDRPDSHKLIFKWFKDYQRKNYRIAGLVDIFSNITKYHWAPNVKWPPRSNFWLTILERKK